VDVVLGIEVGALTGMELAERAGILAVGMRLTTGNCR
jgi:hypothetical protein